LAKPGGSLTGFLSSVLYFEPLLQYKKNGIATLVKTVVPSEFAKDLNNTALSNSTTAFDSMGYEAATKIIVNELSITLKTLKIGTPQKVVPLTVAMLGACLATSNKDEEKIRLFEEAATSLCGSVKYMKGCEIDRLYEFIRTYTGSSKC